MRTKIQTTDLFEQLGLILADYEKNQVKKQNTDLFEQMGFGFDVKSSLQLIDVKKTNKQ
jgi:uncharacterized protein (UPF0335 family)